MQNPSPCNPGSLPGIPASPSSEQEVLEAPGAAPSMFPQQPPEERAFALLQLLKILLEKYQWVGGKRYFPSLRLGGVVEGFALFTLIFY